MQRRDKDEATRNYTTYDSRWKAKSRQTNAEMARTGKEDMARNQMTTAMAEDRKH